MLTKRQAKLLNFIDWLAFPLDVAEKIAWRVKRRKERRKRGWT